MDRLVACAHSTAASKGGTSNQRKAGKGTQGQDHAITCWTGEHGYREEGSADLCCVWPSRCFKHVQCVLRSSLLCVLTSVHTCAWTPGAPT